jgi:hypothetical protein
VRSCLHLVLCFSPVGEAFRQRLRMFPSLVNCTTIDWFSEWPLEALTSVARSFCADLDLRQRSSSGPGGDAGSSLIDGVLAACVHIHQSVEAKSKQYYQELRRCAGCCRLQLGVLAELRRATLECCSLQLSMRVCCATAGWNCAIPVLMCLDLLLSLHVSQVQLRDSHQLP